MIRNELTAEQWKDILSGPAHAATLLMLRAPSNPVKMVGEAMAGGEAFREGLLGAETPVMQAIAQEFQDSDAETLRKQFSTDEKFESVDRLHKDAIYRLQRTMETVRAKGGDADATAYAKWVMHVAGKVANAAKEGGFLGIGGTEISEEEQQVLDELRATLGV